MVPLVQLVRLFCFATFLNLAAALANQPELTTFSELGEPKPFGPAIQSLQVELTDDGLSLQAPNFWSCSWQYENAADFPPVPADPSRLAVKLSGFSENSSLEFHVLLLQRDWSAADVYVIPLSGLSSAPETFLATTTMGNPSERIGGGLSPGEVPAHVQFLLKGTGNKSVNLTLEEVGFVASE